MWLDSKGMAASFPFVTRSAPRYRSGAIFVGSTQLGAVAQLGERCIRIAEVRGSSPLSSTFGNPSWEPVYQFEIGS